MKDRRRWTYLFLILGVILIFSGCSQKQEQAGERPVSVKTLEIKPVSLADQATYVGKAKAELDILISSKIAGKISTIHFAVGDMVKTGDILYELENKDLFASLEQAQQNLLLAEANLSKLLNGARSQEIEQMNQLVNQAKIKYENAQVNFEKLKVLYSENAISKQQYDEGFVNLQLAEANYKSAAEQQSLLEEGASEDVVKAAKAQLGIAEANVKMAEAKLNDTIIRSPINGRIGFVHYNVGEFVPLGVPVIQVIDDQFITLELGISEKDISYLSLGDFVEVKISSLAGEKYVGTVSEIGPASETGIFPVKIKMENKDNKIKQGMSARVTLKLAQKDQIIAVPVDAITEEAGKFYIFVLEKDTAKRVWIETGITNGEMVEVLDGLKPGQKVIVKGQNQLADGDFVQESGEQL